MLDGWSGTYDGLTEWEKTVAKTSYLVGFEQGYVEAKRQLLGPGVIVLSPREEAILGGKLRAKRDLEAILSKTGLTEHEAREKGLIA